MAGEGMAKRLRDARLANAVPGAAPQAPEAPTTLPPQVQTSIDNLAATVATASPADQAAIQAMVLDPQAAQAPGTSSSPAVAQAKTLIEAVAAACKEASLPPEMRGHSKLMIARPIGEVGSMAAEIGLFALAASSLLIAVGIPVTAGSATKAASYLASVSFGTMNLVTKNRFLTALAEGSTHPLTHDPSTGLFSVRRTLGTTARAGALFAATLIGTGVAQHTIGTTEESTRAAGGMQAPLANFREKRTIFERNIAAFAEIPDEILRIAGEIETGKLASDQKYIAWTPAEKEAMKEPLRTLFKNAGLDPAAVNNIQFNEPKSLGYGRAAKVKRALLTGDMTVLSGVALPQDEIAQLARVSKLSPSSSLAEHVGQIRSIMGLKDQERIKDVINKLVRSVLNDDAFQTISTNQVRAERVASQIGRQSEDPWKTFEDAFLHAEPPIGPEAAMPYVRAILNSEKPLENLLQDKLTNKINTLFGTLASSLQTVGGSVTIQAPSVSLDISDIRALGDFISSIASSKVQMAQEEQTVRDRLYDLVQVYLPTASKTESTARYFAITSMRAQGYRVVVQGPTTRVFQKVEGAVEPEPVNQKSDPSTLERAKRTFDGLVERAKKLVGVGTANESLGVWKESISQEELARLMSMTDQELAAHVLPKLDTMASIIQLDSIIRDEDAVTKEGTEGALYSPLMRAARANALREMNRTDLGALVRQQLRLQINVTKTPYIWTPAEWLTVKDALSTATAEPVTLSNQNSIPDVRFWKELPTEKAKQLFEDYTYKEKLKWLATIGGSVGGLVLGVFLLSMYPVYRTNKRLRDSKEDFESLIRTTEQSIVLSLEKLNEILKQIPILKHLPPMDFVTLHAALRMAAEEYDGNTLSENPSPSQRMFHNVVEAFKKGPYAQSVAEYASFLEFLDKLSHSRRMQNKFINIICPGGARAEGLALKAEQKIAQGTSVSPDMVTELTLLEQGIERQTFRDAARGNIRFRVAVNKAQLTVLEHATPADFPTLDPAKVESVIKAEMVRLGTDSAWLEGQLKELDRQALFELNQASFKAALPFSARAGEAFRADNTPIIAFTVDALTTRTYSVPAAIKQSVYARIAQLAV